MAYSVLVDCCEEMYHDLEEKVKFVKKNSCMTRELKLAGSEELVDAVFFVKLISEYSILGGRQYFVVFSKR